MAATQSSTLELDISIERTAVEATERLAKGRVYLERVDERSPLPNGRMPSPTLSKTRTGLPMKLLGVKQLSLLLIGTLLFCHGVFGALHLLCYPPQYAAAAEHAAEHQAAAGAGETHEHPASHDTSTGYFAVLAAGILGLSLGLLLKSTPLRIRLDACLPAALRWVPAVMRPPPTPTPLILQVFRL